MVHTYWSRLKQHMDTRGMGIQQLADALNVSFQAVAKVRDGGAFGLANNLKAAKLFNVSAEWLATGKGAVSAYSSTHPPLEGRSTQSQAHALSFESVTVPSWITWEALMQSKQLPGEFAVRMPDGALGEKVPEGTAMIFKQADAAKPRQCVLVEDKAGGRYIRRYAQASGTSWQAQALDDAYITLHSERDGLRILAVMAWREGGEI